MSGVEVVPAPSSGLVEFSYGDLTHEAATVARDAAAGFRSAQECALREVGRHLMRAKEALPHGAFTPWLQAELGITDRTARYYMQAAAFVEGKPETIAVLPPTVLYALSAPTAPSEIVQAVVDAAAVGEALDARTISARLSDARQADLELKAAQRRTPGITRGKLAANKVKRDQKWKAQQEQETEARARAERETEERMRPLAAAILACPGNVAAALSHALFDYGQREALRALLDAGLREVAQ